MPNLVTLSTTTYGCKSNMLFTLRFGPRHKHRIRLFLDFYLQERSLLRRGRWLLKKRFQIERTISHSMCHGRRSVTRCWKKEADMFPNVVKKVAKMFSNVAKIVTTSVFTLILMFSKQRQNLQMLMDTFARKLVPKTSFKKANLVTLNGRRQIPRCCCLLAQTYYQLFYLSYIQCDQIGQFFKACGNNNFAQITHIIRQFL